jgi:hypothetical protein
MIDPAQIPDEVVEAAARALADDAKLNWDDVPYAHNVMRGEARAAIIAALNAWPNAEVVGWYHADHTLILPLPQKASDD